MPAGGGAGGVRPARGVCSAAGCRSALCDVTGDGGDELVVRFTTAPMAGNTEGGPAQLDIPYQALGEENIEARIK